MFEELSFINSDGFLNRQKRVAFLRSDIETLKEYVSSLNLKAGSTVPGKIVVEESTTPYFEGQEPKINPTSGEICTSDGAFVYRNSYLGTSAQEDTLLKTDRVTVLMSSEAEALKELQN
jgi:hypothetical protein